MKHHSGMFIKFMLGVAVLLGTTLPSVGEAQATLAASVLPTSRSVQVGTTATAFGILINGGTTTATSCSLALSTSIPATFSYQTTDPLTNALTGTPNTPVDLPAGQSQTFIFSLTPTAEIPPTDVPLSFDCTNTDPAPSTVGLNTLLLSASTTPVPDIVALVAVPTNDGVTHLPGATGGIGSTGVFVVASLNVGATGTITVTADTGTASLPLAITLCQTNTGTGVCLAPPSSTVTTDIVANTTPSFGVFVEGLGPIPFDPATNRIFIRFNDQGGITRGSTSVAVQTDGPAPLTITSTATLPPGTVNQLYSFTLTATGGTSPFFWNVIAGSLPGGLTLNASTGQISGTPTAAGTFTVTIQVQDSSIIPQSAQQLFSLAITITGGSPLENIPISTTSNIERDPQIVSDTQGGAIIVWDNSTGNTRTADIYAQRINSAGVPQWAANGVPITTALDDQGHPQLIPDGAGGAIIVWEDERGGGFPDIFAQRVNSNGVPLWTSNGVPIAIATRQVRPRLVSDGFEGAIIVWETGTSDIDIHSQRVNSVGVLQWPIGGVPIASGPGRLAQPEIIADGSGGAIIAWVGADGVTSPVRAQRVNSAGVIQWTANGVPITDFPQRFVSNPGKGGPPKLVPDGSGGAIIAWVGGFGEGSGVRAQRIDSNGVPQWVANGVILDPSEVVYPLAGIVTDGASGAIVTWTDVRNGADLDVFAQRVTDTGQVSWTPDGVPISTAIGDQETPQLIEDSNGGAIIVWQDKRTITEYDLYAQRVDGNGIMQWTVNGVAVSLAMFDQWFPVITTDGVGGAFIAWQDERNDPLNAINQVGGQDIYAQRVNNAGVLQ